MEVAMQDPGPPKLQLDQGSSRGYVEWGGHPVLAGPCPVFEVCGRSGGWSSWQK